jgi:hypothetical protein
MPDREEPDDAYLLRVDRTGIADEPSIGRDRTILSEIAEKYDGQYDRWAARRRSLMHTASITCPYNGLFVHLADRIRSGHATVRYGDCTAACHCAE